MLTVAQSIISVLAWRIPRGAVASLLKWKVVASLLYVLKPAMARAGGIETDTGLLSPPIVVCLGAGQEASTIFQLMTASPRPSTAAAPGLAFHEPFPQLRLRRRRGIRMRRRGYVARQRRRDL